MILNVRLLSELKEMAEGFGIKTNKLGKQDLIYKILTTRRANPPAQKSASAKPEKAKVTTARCAAQARNVTPPTEALKTQKPAADLDLILIWCPFRASKKRLSLLPQWCGCTACTCGQPNQNQGQNQNQKSATAARKQTANAKSQAQIARQQQIMRLWWRGG